MRRACSRLPPLPACGERSRAKRAGEGDPPRPEYLESPPHPDPLPASGEREQTEFAARPDSNSPKSDLISRDDLALAAMHGGRRRHAARPPPQQDRGPPPLERGTPAAARDRRRDADRAEPLERLAQIAVGPGDEERKRERAAPALPFRDDVDAVGGAIERDRRARARRRRRRRSRRPAARCGSPPRDRPRPAG